jgi:hypothetical protein
MRRGLSLRQVFPCVVALLVSLAAIPGCRSGRDAGMPHAAATSATSAAAAPTAATPRAAAPQPPVLILLSFDGFRWDYDARIPTLNLHRVMARGVRAERLIPAFPSKTFPNHYTIVTGLYPAHHNIDRWRCDPRVAAQLLAPVPAGTH